MQFQKNFSLKKYNTFGLSATAKCFATFSSAEELKECLDEGKSVVRKMILGGGSNILFTRNFDGVVLKNEILGMTIIEEDDEYVYIKAGAGVKWHSFVMFCVDHNFSGVENLSLIPGNMGASPMQNIGAYGVEIKDVFCNLEAFHLEEKTQQKFSASDCEFGYRESVFKNKYKNQFAILNVTYRLKKHPEFKITYGSIEKELEKMQVQELSVKAVSDAVISIRSSKLPNPETTGNAGSFFKNPIIGAPELQELRESKLLTDPNIPYYKIDDKNFKIPAGWLIEQCGWKGYRKGDVGCYNKQALVLINYGNATGNEIYDLSEEIKISVKEKFNIELDREVNIV